MEGKYYTIKEVAEIYKINYLTVYNLVKQGKIESINVGLGGERKMARISETALKEFLKNRTTKKTK